MIEGFLFAFPSHLSAYYAEIFFEKSQKALDKPAKICGRLRRPIKKVCGPRRSPTTGSWCTTSGRHLNAATSESNWIIFLRPVSTIPPSSGMFASTWSWCWSTWPVGISQNNSFDNQIIFVGGDIACLPYLSFCHSVSSDFVLALCPSFPRIMQIIHCFSECSFFAVFLLCQPLFP